MGLLPFSAVQAQEAKPAPAAAVETHGTGHAWRASKLIGSDLKNSANESVGEIKDVVVDLKSGGVLGLVVSTGGFLGVADTITILPAKAVIYDGKSKAFVTTYSKDLVGKSLQFKDADYVATDETTLAAKLRGARDAIGGDVSKPDNTAQNEKDMSGKTLTPINQGEGVADLKTTKDVRSAVVGSDLSFNAKNIKIITRDGVVTLRGVVNSKEEHAAVLKLVTDHAGNAKVTDQLEVKK